jgi:hypothetical protein
MTVVEISQQLQMALSTVSAVLLREGLGKHRGLSRPSRSIATSTPHRSS